MSILSNKNLPVVTLASWEGVITNTKEQGYTDSVSIPPWLDICGYDLSSCIEFNAAPFSITDIVEVMLLKEGERDSGAWEWIITLNNRDKYFIQGSCDYTGWDCQSGASYVRLPRER